MCTFVNERQVGAIRIAKTRKHAAEGTGDHPHAGVAFTIHDNVTDGDIPVVTGADGTVCVDNFAFGTIGTRSGGRARWATPTTTR